MKKVERHSIAIILTAMLAAAALLMFLTAQLEELFTQKTLSALQQVVVQYNEAFSYRITVQAKVIETAARSVASLDAEDTKAVGELLDAALKSGSFERIYPVDAQGIAYFPEGVTSDVSQHQYFLDAKAGKNGVGNPTISQINNQTIVALSAPIYIDGVFYGALVGIYNLEAADKAFLSDSFYGTAHGFVVNQTGAYIFHDFQSCTLPGADNLFDLMGTASFSYRNSATMIQKSMARGASGNFSMTVDGRRVFGAFTPSSINDWYMFCMASDLQMAQEAGQINRFIFLLAVALTGIFLTAGGVMLGERRRYEQQIKIDEERFRIACSHISDDILEYNLLTKTMVSVQNKLQEYDLPQVVENAPESLIERGVICRNYTQQLRDAYEKLYRGDKKIECEYKVRRLDGTFGWNKMAMTNIFDDNGQPVRAIGIIQDITEQKERELRLRYRAERDLLTGLFNKPTTETMIQNALDSALPETLNAFIMFDLDHFKEVNDCYGHAAGDDVLAHCGARLMGVFRAHDILGRIGGDEFMIFMQDIPNEDAAIKKANELCAVLSDPFTYEQQELKISCSVGVAFTKDTNSYTELYRRADRALYRAKAQGKNGYCVYDSSFS